jgi:hypothetical protein
MACSSCKKKNKMDSEIIKMERSISTKVFWFGVVWSMLGLYGLYTLIMKLL